MGSRSVRSPVGQRDCERQSPGRDPNRPAAETDENRVCEAPQPTCGTLKANGFLESQGDSATQPRVELSRFAAAKPDAFGAAGVGVLSLPSLDIRWLLLYRGILLIAIVPPLNQRITVLKEIRNGLSRGGMALEQLLQMLDAQRL